MSSIGPILSAQERAAFPLEERGAKGSFFSKRNIAIEVALAALVAFYVRGLSMPCQRTVDLQSDIADLAFQIQNADRRYANFFNIVNSLLQPCKNSFLLSLGEYSPQ